MDAGYSIWVLIPQVYSPITLMEIAYLILRVTSVKNILPHVLNTYLAVSSGNTIPPYPPYATYIFFLFSKATGPSGGSNLLPVSSIFCFFPYPLAYSTWECGLQHRPLFIFGSPPLATFAVVRLICACLYSEKLIPVRCSCHI